MTRESVILNSYGELECRSECLANIQETVGSISNKKKGGRRGREKVRELNTTKQQPTTDPQHCMQGQQMLLSVEKRWAEMAQRKGVKCGGGGVTRHWDVSNKRVLGKQLSREQAGHHSSDRSSQSTGWSCLQADPIKLPKFHTLDFLLLRRLGKQSSLSPSTGY